MKRAFQSELLKLLTTRSTYGILLGAVAINVLAFVAPGENIAGEFSKPLNEHQSIFFLTFLMRVLLLVLGIRAITDEWKHGTLTPSLLVVPRRGRFLAAKAGAMAVVGVAITTLATAAMLATAYLVASSNDVSFAVSSGELLTIGGLVAAGALWPVIGVGFGAVAKSQLFATVFGLVWLMAIEDSIRGRLGDLAGYLPGQAGLILGLAPTGRTWLLGAGVLVGYAVVAMVAGVALLRHRDV